MDRRFIQFTFLILLLIPINPGPVTAEESIPPKNVILMIGDGMGYEHLKLGSLVEYGNDSGLFMQQPHFFHANVTTYSADDSITDSAAAATAMSTGYKTDNGKLAQLPGGEDIETILEQSRDLNKKTGLVTTSYFYHATPAAFASHQESRYDYQEIIPQMLESDTDIILGGGLHLANLGSAIGFEGLIQEHNYSRINSKEELNTLSPENDSKILGTFGTGHITWEADLDVDQDVRLHDMTSKSLDYLDNENGFFLMVEGARIDHAGHDNNKTRNALEVIEFDRTVKLVYEWVKEHPNTLVIVTADHETGGLVVSSSDDLDSQLPGMENTEANKQSRRIDRVGQISVSYSDTYHTSVDVPLIMFGDLPDITLPEILDNTDIYDIMTGNYDSIGDAISPPSPTNNGSSSNSDTSDTSLYFSLMLLVILPLRRKFSS